MAAQTRAPSQGATARERTAYHVLKQTNASGATPTFQLVGRDVDATNSEAAVRTYAEKANAAQATQEGTSDAAEGRYVAIPVRSWKPVTVKTETKTVLKLT